MDLKLYAVLLSVLIAPSLATDQLSYPKTDGAVRIYDSFTRGLWNLVTVVENTIYKDLFSTEDEVVKINEAVGITGNIPQIIVQVVQWKNNLLKRTYTRVRSAIKFVLQKLRQTLLDIEKQYVRTPHITRILSEVLRLGYQQSEHIFWIVGRITNRVNEIVSESSKYVSELHEQALECGPDSENNYENLLAEKLESTISTVTESFYVGVAEINNVVGGTVVESRKKLSQL